MGLILGIIVVTIAAIIAVLYVQIRQTQNNLDFHKEVSSIHTTITQIPSLTVVPTSQDNNAQPLTSTPIVTQKPSVIITIQPTSKAESSESNKTYIVQAGDSLWTIAQSQLHDGYRWKEIAQLNHISNPGTLFKGDRLSLPTPTTVPPTQGVTTQANIDTQTPPGSVIVAPIKGDTYVITRGDDLWDIAQRAYGNPYKYTEIIKANNITNPSLIHAGNTLKIPRNNNP